MGTDLESIFSETFPADTLQLALETLHIKVFTTVFAINPTSKPVSGSNEFKDRFFCTVNT